MSLGNLETLALQTNGEMHGGWVVANATGGWHLDYWLCELVRDSASFNSTTALGAMPFLARYGGPVLAVCIHRPGPLVS